MSIQSKSTRQEADRLLIAGIAKHLATVTSVMVDGVSYTPTQIAALLQQEIDATDAVGPAHAAWSASVAKQRTATSTVTAIKSALRSFVVATFGKASLVLADFGYTKAAAKPSPTLVVAAVEKRLATREARHTTGPVAKKKITGAVPAILPSAASGSGNPPKT